MNKRFLVNSPASWSLFPCVIGFLISLSRQPFCIVTIQMGPTEGGYHNLLHKTNPGGAAIPT